MRNDARELHSSRTAHCFPSPLRGGVRGGGIQAQRSRLHPTPDPTPSRGGEKCRHPKSAEDRLKKFQYELDHPSTNRHPDMLNSLLNAYVGCVDDAADLIQLGIEKQDNIRQGIDLMAGRTKEFLVILEKLSAEGAEREIYKDNLEDAMEGTRDAMNDAEKAKKKMAPPPVRRKN